MWWNLDSLHPTPVGLHLEAFVQQMITGVSEAGWTVLDATSSFQQLSGFLAHQTFVMEGMVATLATGECAGAERPMALNLEEAPGSSARSLLCPLGCASKLGQEFGSTTAQYQHVAHAHDGKGGAIIPSWWL